jgi:hypothetical protein
MKITPDKFVFFLLTAILGFYAVPTQASKNSGGLRLSRPIETPNAVQFSWTGGATNTSYSIYRRISGSTGAWERITMGLQGVSGSTTVPGFTLDRSWTYELRAETP